MSKTKIEKKRKMIKEKKELIDSIKERTDKLIKDIVNAPEYLLDLGGTLSENIYDSKCIIYIKITTIEQMYEKLHEIRKYDTATIGQYWTPWEKALCINYTLSNGYAIRFDFDNVEIRPILETISNGKCKIETQTQETIVCKI